MHQYGVRCRCSNVGVRAEFQYHKSPGCLLSCTMQVLQLPIGAKNVRFFPDEFDAHAAANG